MTTTKISNKKPGTESVPAEKRQIPTQEEQKRKYPRVLRKPSGPSLTKQYFLKDTNLNSIMEKYQSTGVLESTTGTPRQPQFGDFSDVKTYKEGLDSIINAQSAFDDLPAKIRKRFGNNPSNFIEFMDDINNLDEARRLGIVAAEKPKPQPKVGDKKTKPTEASKPSSDTE